MDTKLYDEIVYLLDELAQDNTIPKNVRKHAHLRSRLSFLFESLALASVACFLTFFGIVLS